MVAPISAGLLATRTPAASKAAILSAAVPRPPAMMAPACPMRLPGGAVCPATKATTGLVMCVSDELRGLLLRRAADLTDQDDAFGVGIVLEQAQRVDESGADDRIAADADAGRLPEPELRQLVHRFVGQRAAARHDADACPACGCSPA